MDGTTAAAPAGRSRNGNAIRHHKALPHGEVAEALAKVRDSESHAGVRLALEFMVLTATRSNEVRGAACDEVEHDVWTIPADRMKAKREHRVPLSGRALEILEEARKLHGGGGIVFRGAKGGRIHASMFSKLLRRLGIAGTPHGMRSSFHDWCSETGVAREVAEAALAHKVRSQAEAAYARSDLLDRRREVMHEMFTINRLGLPPRLRKCLGSTNLIDSTHSGVRQKTRRVTNWKNGAMALRWAAASFVETEKSYRRIIGYDQLWMLRAHLDDHESVAEMRKAG